MLVKIDQEVPVSGVVVNLYEAKSRLSALVERAAAGEEIIIAKAGHPKARLVPFARARQPREPGGWEGRVWMSDDFDEPLPPDILKGFAGEE
jgi:prevent-host-death family protein